jgi:eukaryotic-like serine/threonine-protein kinase
MLARDEARAARRLVAEEKGRWTRHGFHLQHWNQLYADSSIDLYVGRGVRAHRRMEGHWGSLTRSLVLQVQLIRVEAYQLRVTCALSAACSDSELAPVLLRKAERWIKRLEKEKRPWIAPIAAMLRGCVCMLRGEGSLASEWMVRAADGFDSQGMRLYAAIARFRLSQTADGEAAEVAARRAHEYMAAEGVVNPARLSNVFAPGIAIASARSVR